MAPACLHVGVVLSCNTGNLNRGGGAGSFRQGLMRSLLQLWVYRTQALHTCDRMLPALASTRYSPAMYNTGVAKVRARYRLMCRCAARGGERVNRVVHPAFLPLSHFPPICLHLPPLSLTSSTPILYSDLSPAMSRLL